MAQVATPEVKEEAAALKAQGNALYKANRLEEALVKYGEAISAWNGDPTFFSNRAAVLMRLGRPGDALADCDAALALDASYSRALLRAADAETQLGLFDEAVVRLAPHAGASAQVDTALKRARELQGVADTMLAASQGVLQPSVSKPSSDELPAGESLAGDGDTTMTEEGSPGAAASGAGAGAGAGALSGDNTASSDRRSRSEVPTPEPSAMERVAAAAPHSLSVALTRARCLFSQRRYKSAAAVSNKAVAAHPTDTGALFVLSWCLASDGNLSGAQKTLQRAVSLDPDSKVLVSAFRAVKKLAAAKEAANAKYKAGNFVEAASAYRDAQTLALAQQQLPAGIAALYGNLAAALLALDDVPGALQACNAAIKANPYFSRAHQRKATCLQKLGKADEAIASLERAQWLNPSSSTLPHTLHAAKTAQATSSGIRGALTCVKPLEDAEDWPAVLREATENDQLVVVDFFATWCRPCQMIGPVVDQISLGYSHVRFVKADEAEVGELTLDLGVGAFPTFKFYRGGKEVAELKGADQAQLLSLVQQHSQAPATLDTLPVAPWAGKKGSKATRAKH